MVNEGLMGGDMEVSYFFFETDWILSIVDVYFD
jgi:hypothetical protein